jgi:hypothetical protein
VAAVEPEQGQVERGAGLDLLRTHPVLPEEQHVSSNPATQITTTVELVKEYARQETIGHFKGIGRWIGFGLGGATCLSIGIVLLVVGLLRLLQTVGDDVFYGFWSITPYLIALVVCALVVALALSRVQATDVHRQAKKRQASAKR